MDLNLYFDPVSLEKPGNFNVGENLFRSNIFIHTQNSNIKNLNFRIAIIGVPEERNTINKGCAGAPNLVRNKLYQLTKIESSKKIADLGNLKTGHKIEDAYYALRDVCYHLISNNILPVIIGGSQDLTYGIFLAYKKLKLPANLVTIDSRLDIGKSKQIFNSYSYLTKIIFEKNKYLQNYINIGHQGYFISKNNFQLLKKLYFESIRIGQVRQSFQNIEPIIRDSNLVSLDISSVKQSEAPGHAFPTPNGFYNEEICQLARYSGISDKLKSFGIFEINPDFDNNNQTTHLAAQIIWLFIDGYINRYNENPELKSNKIKKFIVNLNKFDRDIVFYKSILSNRWWIEIPTIENKIEKTKTIACSYDDYIKACNNEMPDIYLKAFQKLE